MAVSMSNRFVKIMVIQYLFLVFFRMPLFEGVVSLLLSCHNTPVFLPVAETFQDWGPKFLPAVASRHIKIVS